MASTKTNYKSTGGLPSLLTLTTRQAFVGLHLHTNWELADALETYIIGYIDCITSNDIQYIPSKCAGKAVEFFTLHGSWSTNGGDHPWTAINKDWMNTAMNKIIHHVYNGNGLSDLALPDNEPENEQAEGSGSEKAQLGTKQGKEISMEDVNDSLDDNQDNEDDDVYMNKRPRTLFAVPTGPRNNNPAPSLPASRRLIAFPITSSSKSLSRLRSLCKDNITTAPSSLSSSSPFSASFSSLPKQLAGSSSIGNHQPRHQTTSLLTRAAAVRAASISARGKSVLANNPTHHHHHHQYGTRSQRKTSGSSRGRGRGRGHSVKTDANTGETYDVWAFQRILDCRQHSSGSDLEYKVKWTYHRPSWTAATDLAENPDEIAEFHEKHPGKPGPPDWFTRGRNGGT